MAPYLVMDYKDPINGAKGYAVVDTFINGVAGGGIRMREGLTQNEVVDLAHTMTLKFSLLEPILGGAKFGLDYNPKNPDKAKVLQRFVCALKDFFLNCCVTGADINTTENEIIEALRKAGIPCPQYALAKAYCHDEEAVKEAILRFSKGISLRVDDFVMNDAITGYGVCCSAEKAMEILKLPIETSKIAIQGFGKVGAPAAMYLSRLGATIVAISDVEATIFCESGLDIGFFHNNRDELGVIRKINLPSRYKILERDSLLYLPVDILIPAAVSNVINSENESEIKAQLIVEVANNSIVTSANQLLENHGILVVPDFVANGGAAFLYGALIAHLVEPAPDSIMSSWKSLVQSNTTKVIELSREKNICTRDAAVLLSQVNINNYIGNGGSSLPEGLALLQTESSLTISYL